MAKKVKRLAKYPKRINPKYNNPKVNSLFAFIQTLLKGTYK